jgi:hypothetical protein
MWKVPDLRFTWVLGFGLIVLGGLGVLIAGAIIGIPILLIAAAAGCSLSEALRWTIWASPLWAPLGAGMGMQVTGMLVRSYRSEAGI